MDGAPGYGYGYQDADLWLKNLENTKTTPTLLFLKLSVQSLSKLKPNQVPLEIFTHRPLP